MSHRRPAPPPARRVHRGQGARRVRLRRVCLAGLLAALAAVAGAGLGREVPVSLSSSTAAATLRVPREVLSRVDLPPVGLPPVALPRRERRAALGEADGRIPDGTTVFDDGVPGVADLDADLLRALRAAADDAGGVAFVVDSGRRSPAYQAGLLREAVQRYGSAEEAARWVATPETSAHVSGDAVDLGSAAADWLAEHGAAYGLCRVYANEPWHFELRPDAAAGGCPPTYADPTHDPRMHP